MIDSVEPSAPAEADAREDIERVIRQEAAERRRPDDTFRLGPFRFHKNPLNGLTVVLSLLVWAVIGALVYFLW